jgi:hypothetical protein
MKNKNPNEKPWKFSHFSKYLMEINSDSQLAKNMNIKKAISALKGKKNCCESKSNSEAQADHTKTVQEIAFRLASEVSAKDKEILELKTKLELIRIILKVNPLPQEFIEDFVEEQKSKANNPENENE